jgi:exopolyphosphatase / guanosine-5'-triphosphate,3'-diphosphate pyrophosphatase
MPRYAVIDIGTNSIKFHIGEKRNDGTWGVVVDRADITRLGEGLQTTGEISPEAMERAAGAIGGMVAEARQNETIAIAAVGTMGLRTARNSAVLIDRVRAQTGVSIEVISGDEESRLAYIAVKSGIGLSSGSMVIFDTGGGSTEFTFGRGTTVNERYSLNVGAIRFTEQFGLGTTVPPDVLARAIQAIARDLAALDSARKPDALVGMGGTVTNIAGVKHRMAKYDPDVVQGSVIERNEIERQISMYAAQSTDERRQIVGLQPKRADVILAGVCIVKVIMDKLSIDTFSVSDRGLRHGLLVDRFSN